MTCVTSRTKHIHGCRSALYPFLITGVARPSWIRFAASVSDGDPIRKHNLETQFLPAFAPILNFEIYFLALARKISFTIFLIGTLYTKYT